MGLINVPEYIRPLIAYRNDGTGYYPDGRFVGSCFFIDTQGTAITCAHIIDDMCKNEELFTFDFTTKENQKISIIYKHPRDDFAVISIPTNKNKHFTIRHDRVVLGMNIMSYGFINGGVTAGEIKVEYRVMKGHVSRLDSQPSKLRSRQIIETSFPSLAGFSGAPIFCEDGLDLVGMLFGNVESDIEVFSLKEVKDGTNLFTESVYRIVELGVAHTSDAIVNYIKESKNGSA